MPTDNSAGLGLGGLQGQPPGADTIDAMGNTLRGGLKAVVLVVALLSACVWEPVLERCDCPNLERLAGTLRWLPDTPNSSVLGVPHFSDQPDEVRVLIVTTDPERDFATLEERLASTGLEVRSPADQLYVEFDGLVIIASVNEPQGESAVRTITVLVRNEASLESESADDLVPELMAPLVEALGLEDPPQAIFCSVTPRCEEEIFK